MRSSRACAAAACAVAAVAVLAAWPEVARAQPQPGFDDTAPAGEPPPPPSRVEQRVDRETPLVRPQRPSDPNFPPVGDGKRGRSPGAGTAAAPATPAATTAAPAAGSRAAGSAGSAAARPRPPAEAEGAQGAQGTQGPEDESDGEGGLRAAPLAPRPQPPAPQPYLTGARPITPAVKTETPDSAAAALKRLMPGGPPSPSEELIRKSRTSVDFYELVDEILDEIAYQLGKQDAALLSPMAVRMVRLSPELRPELAGTLQARLLARIAQSTSIKTSVCVECNSLRSRVEEGQWLVTLGAVRQEDLRRIGQTQGIKTFVDLGFSYSPSSNVIWMEAVAFRASDGSVIWTDAYRSDLTTAMLLRTGRRIPSRAERLAELDQKLAGRPYYGYAVGIGLLRVGYDGPTGDIMGPQVTIRIHERFGENQQQLFGLQGGFFSTGSPSPTKTVINSILGAAYFSWNLSEPSFNRPELWAYGELGGMFSGNQGNTAYGEGGLDLHLKWRLSMQGGVQYVLPTKFADHDLGGTGWRLRIVFNW